MNIIIRKLISICLCWTLYAGQLSVVYFSYSFVSNSYAQDTTDVPELGTEQDDEKVNKSEHWIEKKSDIYGSSSLNAVTLLLIGWAAGALMKCAKKTPSGNIFIVGGIVYLVGELTTAFNLKRKVQHEIKIYEKTRYLDASQKEALHAMIKGYDKYIDAIKTRMGFIMGAFIAIQIAAAMSFAEGFKRRGAKGDFWSAYNACMQGAPGEMASGGGQTCPNCMQRAQQAAQVIGSHSYDNQDGNGGGPGGPPNFPGGGGG